MMLSLWKSFRLLFQLGRLGEGQKRAAGQGDSLEHKEESAGAYDEAEGDVEDACVRGHHDAAVAAEFVASREHLPFPGDPRGHR